MYRRDRVGGRHSGVCVDVNKDLYSRRRPDHEVQNMEGIWFRNLCQ